jgi:hypothetical protein
MKAQRGLLSAYRILLYLYPPAFRQRFAQEMLAVAEAAEATEWPLIFGDTSVAIVRCWLEGSPSTTAARSNAFLPIPGSPIRGSAIIHGLVVSLVLISGFCYASYRWPPPCPNQKQILTPLVAPAPAGVNAPGSRRLTQVRAK